MNCQICHGEGWVCENHENHKWNYGDPSCCGGAGMPCKCNSSSPPWHHIDTTGEIDHKEEKILFSKNAVYKIRQKKR